MADSFSTNLLCSAASLFMCSRNLQDDLEELAKIKDELSALREYAMHRLTGGDKPKSMPVCRVKTWISDVEVKVAEVNKLISYGVEGFWSKICFCSRIEKILSELMALKNRAPPLPSEPKVESVDLKNRAPPQSEPKIVGLEKKLKEVWKCLTTDEVSVIGIWGMGGIGKTTLLTQLNSKCLSHFDFVIWLQVSYEVKLEDLQDEFVKQIGLSKEKISDDKVALITQVLQNKKVLVLLDDLWNRVELEDIGIPQNNQCQVVFTTRSKVVCRLMGAQRSIEVEPLGQEKALQLFQDRVGIETFAAHGRISCIAKKIVKECQGLPLALIASAHAMFSKKYLQEWKHSAKILRKSASRQVFSVLKLSYDRLPHQNMKSCLLYCSLFPEHFDIPKEELIDKWIGEGFLDYGIDQTDPINKGYNIVETLVDLSLLEDKGAVVRMHDVIRDMCLWIACKVEKEKHSYYVQGGTQFRNELPREKLRDARRISLMQNKCALIRLTQVPGSPHISTLLLSRNREFEKTIVDGFFRYMKALTVLDLSETGIKVLPTDISELVSLQYLDLSTTNIKVLPLGIMKLEKLLCLNLEYTAKLREIPRGMIASLKSLQIFRIVGSDFILCEYRVAQLERLENLKALSLTIKDAYIYHHILNSQKLSGCLQALLVEDLEPPFGELLGTKTQTVYRINKTRCFDKLRKVHISCCHYLEDLTWVLRAPNLKELSVRCCENLEVISSYEGEEEDLNPFARLKFLDLIGLPKLKSICWKPMLFPFLDKIRVCGCPMLKKLPLNVNSAKGRDLAIQGTTDWWIKLQWEDDATRIAFRFCFGEIVWPYRRDGINTKADRDRGIQHRIRCLLENLDRLAETKTLIGESETKTLIEELVGNFSNSYIAWKK